MSVSRAVEHEVFKFDREICGVTDLRRQQISLGLLRNIARIAAISLAGYRIANIADHYQGGDLNKGIEEGGCRVGDCAHVTFLGPLEPARRRSVEADPAFEAF